MPVRLAPFPYAIQGSVEALRGRLPVNRPVALSGNSPVMGEAQEVERARPRVPRRRCVRRRSVWLLERAQPGLLRVDGQPELAKSLWQHLENPARIRFLLEDDREIVCIPDE